MRREGRMPVAAQTRLYHLDRLFQTRSTTYIPVGEGAQGVVRTQLAAKSVTDVIPR